MHVHANKLVLEAVISFGLSNLILSFLLSLNLFLSQLVLVTRLNLVAKAGIVFILLLLEAVLFTHNFMEAVRFEIENVREGAE